MSENTQYKPDPELDILVPPYDESELQNIRVRLLSDKASRIVHTWNDTYILNRHTYDILNELEVPYLTKKHPFSDKKQVAVYLCINQLKRNDLTSTYRKFLIGSEYRYKSEIEQATLHGIYTSCRLSSILGTKYDLTLSSVYRYRLISEAISNIYEKDQDMARFILMDRCHISRENITEISRLKTDEIKAVYKSVCDKNMPKITSSLIRTEIKHRFNTKMKSPIIYEQEKIIKEKSPAIRQMPAYDPDAEVNSLCMTIEYWITSIQRVDNTVDFKKITTDARIQLMKKLSFLDNTIESLQKSLVERTRT